MNFVTLEFAIFFLAVLLLFSLPLRTLKAHKFFLLLFNIVFYACAGVQFIPLLFLVAFINWLCAYLTNSQPIKKHGCRRAVISLAVFLQICILGFYKYYEFFIINTENLLASLGAEISLIGLLPSVDILLPVGLSFYIFQGLSYAIDRYRDTGLKPLGYFDVLLFVSFFPTILAGPIMRSKQFFPQFMADPVPHDPEYKAMEKTLINRDVAEGFAYILSGLFKKVVLASYLSEHIVRDVFQSPEFYSSETLLIAMYAYAMQIFCDFSGYTDMALGIGRLMGIKIPRNFNAPYLATSLQDFWHRWHISLSTWLRDYLYISLGGNRKGNKYLNLFITMTLGGLWHGANLRYLIWGMAHGLGLIVNHAWQQLINPKKRDKSKKQKKQKKETEKQEEKRSPLSFIRSLFGWFLTFHTVCVLWLFFRADSTDIALAMLTRMGELTTEGDGYPLLVLIAIAAAMSIQIAGRHVFSAAALCLEKAWLPIKIVLVTLAAAIIFKMGPEGVLPFIYFQF